jgi:hypothetical protein
MGILDNEKGAEKWRKEHMSRKGKGDISEEGQEYWKTEKFGETRQPCPE